MPRSPTWIERVGAAIAVSTGFLVPSAGEARELYLLTVESEGVTVSRDIGDVSDLIDALSPSEVDRLIPAATSGSRVVGRLDIRGVPATGTYPAGTTDFSIDIPCTGTRRTFTGATRTESFERFRDYLEADGDAEANRIRRCLVADTAADFVAGNPASLVGRAAYDDLRLAGLPRIPTPQAQYGVGLETEGASAGDFEIARLSVPLYATTTLDNPGSKPTTLVASATFDAVQVSSSASYSAMAAIGATATARTLALLAVDEAPAALDRWSLTPMLRIGAVGSPDTDAQQGVVGAALVSNLRVFAETFAVTLTNAYSRYETVAIADIDYGLSNGLFQNGLSVEAPVNARLLGQRASVRIGYMDTRVTGSPWFNDWYGRASLSYGTAGNPARPRAEDLRVGIYPTFGEDFFGVVIGAGYRF